MSNLYGNEQLWKINEKKAMKNGNHSTIYWVKYNKRLEDGSFKGSKWKSSYSYTGEWNSDKKHGFGVQVYSNGDRYEGEWKDNKKCGKGTIWVKIKGNFKRLFTGDFMDNKMHGKGTMFYDNGDRYDGDWVKGFKNGQGRMIYNNGDVYIGEWNNDKKNGYGILTKRNGDHFEGHFVEDMKEGEGSYYFCSKGKIMIGQWVDNQPKTAVYCHVENENIIDKRSPKLPNLELKNAEEILQNCFNTIINNRIYYRAKYIPLHLLYDNEKLEYIIEEFYNISNNEQYITKNECLLLLERFELNINIDKLIENIKYLIDNDIEKMDFELFVRVYTILLEDNDVYSEIDVNNDNTDIENSIKSISNK